MIPILYGELGLNDTRTNFNLTLGFVFYSTYTDIMVSLVILESDMMGFSPQEIYSVSLKKRITYSKGYIVCHTILVTVPYIVTHIVLVLQLLLRQVTSLSKISIFIS